MTGSHIFEAVSGSGRKVVFELLTLGFRAARQNFISNPDGRD